MCGRLRVCDIHSCPPLHTCTRQRVRVRSGERVVLRAGTRTRLGRSHASRTGASRFLRAVQSYCTSRRSTAASGGSRPNPTVLEAGCACVHVVASAYALAMRPRLHISLHMDLRSTPEAMAKVTPWVVWANAALDPILFLENDRGQVIGTRLTQNPRQIQVRASSPTLSFSLFLPPITPAPRPHLCICISRSLARPLARTSFPRALSFALSLAPLYLSPCAFVYGRSFKSCGGVVCRVRILLIFFHFLI